MPAIPAQEDCLEQQTIGDTCGVAGVFRGLHTMPFCIDLCHDVQAVGGDGAVAGHHAAVEVACLVNHSGVQPCHFGDLPTQLAAMCQMNISVHQLAVEAILERDRRRVYWSLMMDPLTHSRLTIDQIEAVVDELVNGQQDYLGAYL